MTNNIIMDIDSERLKIVFKLCKSKQSPLLNAFNKQKMNNVLTTGQTNYYQQRYTHQQFSQLVELIKTQSLSDEYKQNRSVIDYNVFLTQKSHKILDKYPQIKAGITVLANKQKLSINKLAKNDSVWQIMQLEIKNQQFYTFQKTFHLIELEQINSHNQVNKRCIQQIPKKFMMAVIKKQLTLYEINLDTKTADYLMRSIIGQLTIQSIAKKLFPDDILQSSIQKAFQHGQFSNNDLLVEDIYGQNTQTVGLGGKIIASSLGKIFKSDKSSQQILSQRKNDIMKSLAVSFAINNANLMALSLLKHNLSTVVVVIQKLNHQCIECLIQSIVNAYAPGKQVYFCKNMELSWLIEGII